MHVHPAGNACRSVVCKRSSCSTKDMFTKHLLLPGANLSLLVIACRRFAAGLFIAGHCLQDLQTSAVVLETELLDYLQTFHANAKNRLPKPNKQYLQNLAAKGLLQAGSLSHVLANVSGACPVFISCDAVG